MRSATILLSESQATAQLYAAGQSSKEENASHTHMKKALAMQRSGSPATGRGGKQLTSYHSLIRYHVLLPIPPFQLYNYMLPFVQVNSKIALLALGGVLPIHYGI